MVRLTRQTDYGIVLLTFLARDRQEMVPATELARESQLPEPMVRKTLKVLSSAGLLDSQRGVHGGYVLARPATEITVAEIIETLEGPVSLTECTDEEGCEHEFTCPVRYNMQVINDAVRRALHGITLSELREPLPQPLLTLEDDEG